MLTRKLALILLGPAAMNLQYRDSRKTTDIKSKKLRRPRSPTAGGIFIYHGARTTWVVRIGYCASFQHF